MSTNDNLANRLSVARGDHFGMYRDELSEHAEEHGCGARVREPWQARQLAVFARAIRATYVLHIGAGTGYTSLHVAGAFGHTGRLDAVESDGNHAALLEQTVNRYALADRVRVMRGRPEEIVPPLNGPYDLIIVEGALDPMAQMSEDLVRLVRVGGSLAVVPDQDDEDSMAKERPGREWLERVARDERTEVSASGDLEFIMVVRVR